METRAATTLRGQHASFEGCQLKDTGHVITDMDFTACDETAAQLVEETVADHFASATVLVPNSLYRDGAVVFFRD